MNSIQSEAPHGERTWLRSTKTGKENPLPEINIASDESAGDRAFTLLSRRPLRRGQLAC